MFLRLASICLRIMLEGGRENRENYLFRAVIGTPETPRVSASEAFIVMKAADEFKDKTAAPNQLWLHLSEGHWLGEPAKDPPIAWHRWMAGGGRFYPSTIPPSQMTSVAGRMVGQNRWRTTELPPSASARRSPSLAGAMVEMSR
jgi:hypothetical protein